MFCCIEEALLAVCSKTYVSSWGHLDPCATVVRDNHAASEPLLEPPMGPSRALPPCMITSATPERTASGYVLKRFSNGMSALPRHMASSQRYWHDDEKLLPQWKFHGIPCKQLNLFPNSISFTRCRVCKVHYLYYYHCIIVMAKP